MAEPQTDTNPAKTADKAQDAQKDTPRSASGRTEAQAGAERRSFSGDGALPENQAQAEAQAATDQLVAAGKRGAEARAEMLQFSAKAAQDSMEQFSGMFGLAGDRAQDAAHRSTRNLDAIVQCNTALAIGGQDIARVWLDFVQTRMRHNAENLDRALSCRTLMEFSAVQSDIVRQSMEDLVQNNLRLAESSAQVARDAARRCSPSAG